MMELLIATGNPSKLQRMRETLAEAQVICHSPAELGLVCDAPETASDAAGNALQKALAWHRLCGMPVYAEDSGLVFLDLPRDHADQPGVHVRRPRGVIMDDDTMRAYYQQLARKHGGHLRSAWQSANCILFTPDDYAIFESTDDMLLKHSFVLTDRDNGKRMPGWPLESLKEAAADGTTVQARADYWAYLGKWLREQIYMRKGTSV